MSELNIGINLNVNSFIKSFTNLIFVLMIKGT
jgi:hypothetical protein